MSDWSDEQTDDPLYADDRNFYKVEAWSRDGMRIDALLYAGNNLDKAREIFVTTVKHRPRIRLTIRQRTRVLQRGRRNEKPQPIGVAAPKSGPLQVTTMGIAIQAECSAGVKRCGPPNVTLIENRCRLGGCWIVCWPARQLPRPPTPRRQLSWAPGAEGETRLGFLFARRSPAVLQCCSNGRRNEKPQPALRS